MHKPNLAHAPRLANGRPAPLVALVRPSTQSTNRLRVTLALVGEKKGRPVAGRVHDFRMELN